MAAITNRNKMSPLDLVQKGLETEAERSAFKAHQEKFAPVLALLAKNEGISAQGPKELPRCEQFFSILNLSASSLRALDALDLDSRPRTQNEITPDLLVIVDFSSEKGEKLLTDLSKNLNTIIEQQQKKEKIHIELLSYFETKNKKEKQEEPQKTLNTTNIELQRKLSNAAAKIVADRRQQQSSAPR